MTTPPASPFADSKAPGAMRTIGEVAAALGIRQHILRYWEQQFPMLKPLKRSGGRRLYRPEDVALVQRIDQLVNREGYTLKGARAVLEGRAAVPFSEKPAGHAADTVPSSAPAPAPATSPGTEAVAEVRSRLRQLRQRLARALDAA
ncbi:MerR family transcriptional regulator [Altererythrobacter lauratis]|uniref:MerR family transcriptional regulator n=1 Tax=Alteraurantiacibacter lauratis TaxID=2054627 RepID=A0ABV7EG42_9SPHN